MLKTRLLKASCPECGYIVRVTRRWILVGFPVCPCGTTMEASEPIEGTGDGMPGVGEWPSTAVLYFVQAGAGGPVKIGYTAELMKRLPLLQVGSAARLQLLASTPAQPGTEHEWHRRFVHLRIRGEWFEPAPELLEAIDALSAELVHP